MIVQVNLKVNEKKMNEGWMEEWMGELVAKK